MGDININIGNINTSITRRYIETIHSLGCRNLVDIPTRYGLKSQSILDHIITNYENTEHGVLDYAMTDHLPVFTVLNKSSIAKEPENSQGTYW